MSDINPDYIKINAHHIPRWHDTLDQKGALAIMVIGQDVDGKLHVFKQQQMRNSEVANQLRVIAQSLDNQTQNIVS